MARWMLYNKKADFNEIASYCGISPITARLIRNRDVIGKEATKVYLEGTLSDLSDPRSIPGMEEAALLLQRKIAEKRKIRVIGDYDVDGICSSYILWRLLVFLGADVSVAIPDRIRDGYGINERLVLEAAKEGIDTILTCDNGIAAAAPLQKAKELGLCVIVTDHHEIPYREDEAGHKTYLYPPADVIAEPWIPQENSGKPLAPFPDICGAVVVFKLSQMLLDYPDISAPKSALEGEKAKLLREFLGFAGLATVCDVMPLTGENRIFVKYGLQEATYTDNLGLRCLIIASSLQTDCLTVYHAGFVIGPCINASGRLGSAQQALALFQEKDEDRAMLMARDLKELNERRKSMTEEGVERACFLLEEDEKRGRELASRRVLVLVLGDTHESVAGIVAGRLKEQYHRPAIVLTNTKEPGVLKGSGRSIDAYDMYEEMNRCRELFIRFGGHKMAAGLTMKEENVRELDARLNRSCLLSADDLQEVLHIDMELPPRLLSRKVVKEFSLLEPCGTKNTKAVLVAKKIWLKKTAVYGKSRNVIRLEAHDQEGNHFNFVWFVKEEELPSYLNRGLCCCHVVYEPQINVFRGQESIQFVVKDVRKV